MNDFERIDRINRQIQNDLSQILMDYAGDFIISVVKVDTSKDLSNSKVFISVLGDNSGLIEKLNSSSKQIRMDLAKKIKLLKTPRLEFIIDLEDNSRENIEELLK